MYEVLLPAAISASGVLGAAAVGAWVQLKLKKHLGSANGSGSALQILERLEHKQDLISRRLDDHVYNEAIHAPVRRRGR